MTTQKYKKTLLSTEIFHGIESVVQYVNNECDIADFIAANYAFNACDENGY